MVLLQEILKRPLQAYINEPITGLALAITFGIKDSISKSLYDEIKVVGVSHMMVLSGANISMFIAFVSSVLYFLPTKIREVVAICITIVFLSLIPMQPSIVRAALMNFIPRIGMIFGKRSHSLYLLFFTCSLILCFDTSIVYDISFQLSFLAIFGISVFSKSSEHNGKEMNIVMRLIYTIKEQILMGLSAQVFTVPLIFYYFGSISLVSPIANILLSPLISPIMISTIMILVTHKFLPVIAGISGFSLNYLVSILTFVIQTLSKIKILYIQY